AACRPLLFTNWQSAPKAFKDWIEDVDQLASHRPCCDFQLLRQTLETQSAWFNELRGISPTTGKKGIRDALEHRGVRLIVGKQQTDDARPDFHAILDSRASDVEIHKDVLPRIRGSVVGLCRLMTALHAAIGVGSEYEWGDFLSLVGNVDDSVGYWPQLQQ
ncbi:MAG: hypothetical protein Q8K82_11950, partial [Gemmatimonadaceae bacterium]|nr:hypothetical protein [Gemmatimonadaceae bacterium]